MLDHVSIPAEEFERSARFYDAALAPLGIERIRTPELDGIRIADYGSSNVLAFSVGAPKEAPTDGWTVVPLLGMHVAFTAPTRASVDAFYAAGVGAGGEDNGAPGLRPEYEPNYYAAYLIDPDGHHIEAVCRSAD
jgi:catechol 2,3-dioxygenase-like lactoylglutathione lyase family enzyme